MSAKTRGTGLGYHFPQNCNPDVTNDERAFRQAFNSLQKKQKQRFTKELFFNKYKKFEHMHGLGPRLT